MNYNEETITEKNSQYNDEETIVENNKHNGSATSDDSQKGWSKKENGNWKSKVAAAAVGATATGTAAAAVGYVHYRNEHAGDNHDSEETEQDTSENHGNSHGHHASAQLSSAPEHTEIQAEVLEPQEPTQQTVQVEPQTEIVEVSPSDVEIIGVEHVQTDESEMAIGGMTVGGEEFILVDVDNNNQFDVAWHDDNNDQQIQETELIDISGENIQVDEFAQLAGQEQTPMQEVPETPVDNDINLADNYMDSPETGAIDYLDDSDTSGLV